MFLGSLYCKPYGPRPDCSQTSQVDAFYVTLGVTQHSLILNEGSLADLVFELSPLL